MTPHPLRWPLEPLPAPEPSGHGGTVQSQQQGIAPGGKNPPCASDGGAEPATTLAPVGTARGALRGTLGGFLVPVGSSATQRGQARRHRCEKSPVSRSRV